MEVSTEELKKQFEELSNEIMSDKSKVLEMSCLEIAELPDEYKGKKMGISEWYPKLKSTGKKKLIIIWETKDCKGD